MPNTRLIPILFSAAQAWCSRGSAQGTKITLARCAVPLPCGISRLVYLAFTFWLLAMSGVAASASVTQQQAYLKAFNLEDFDEFGTALDISGDTAIVGAPEENGGSTGVDGDGQDKSKDNAGAAYIFTRDAAGNWTRQAYVKASNSDVGDRFGTSVAISGDLAVVGAPRERSAATGVDGNEQDNSRVNAGAAYVFVRDGDGNWAQQAYLKASNTLSGDLFGTDVAISGNTVIVGAEAQAAGQGAAYIFFRDGSGNWSQQAFLKASDAASGDRFGFAVAVDGDTAIVGARSRGNRTGAVYVFERNGSGNWSEQDVLTASNAAEFADFGNAVSLSQDVAAIGALFQGDDGEGAAYVFTRDGSGVWSEETMLKATNAENSDQFGSAVAVAQGMLVVGAQGEDSDATGLDADGSDNSLSLAGAAYAFARDSDGQWQQQTYIKPSNTHAGMLFGSAVALDQGTLVVGAEREDGGDGTINGDESDLSARNAGAAYVLLSDFTVDTFTVAGQVSGLDGAVTLRNNGADDLNMLADGGFNFPTPLPDGSPYQVTVAAQPQGQTCTVTNGEGVISGANVTDVQVSCSDDGVAMFDIGGTVSGLDSGNMISIRRVLGDSVTGKVLGSVGNREWTFRDIPDGSEYQVTVRAVDFPEDQSCTIENPTGTINGANVDDVAITCTPRVTRLSAHGGPGSASVDLVTSGGTGIGCSLETAAVVTPPLGGPAGFELPFGAVDFSAVGCLDDEVTVELTFDDDLSGATWFKFVNGSWQELPGVTITGNTASFSLVDNGPFDADPVTGAIRDPSGPAFPAQQGAPTPGVNGDPRPIPAASGVALFVLFVLLTVVGIRSQRGLHA